MTHEYAGAYILGQQATADLTRDLELRRRIAERAAVDEPTRRPTSAPASAWFHNMFGRAPGHHPAALH